MALSHVIDATRLAAIEYNNNKRTFSTRTIEYTESNETFNDPPENVLPIAGTIIIVNV